MADVSVLEFWQLTPKETFYIIEAFFKKQEQQHKHAIGIAWQTANLVRAKKLPQLKQLLAPKKAQPLKGKELEKRKQEFKEMSTAIDLSKIKR